MTEELAPLSGEEIAELRGLFDKVTRLSRERPLPWKLWTSNSHRRIGSASGKDGDVAYAYRHKDGCYDIVAQECDLAYMVAAANAVPRFLSAASRSSPEAAATAERLGLADIVADARNARLYAEKVCDGLLAVASAHTSEAQPIKRGVDFDIPAESSVLQQRVEELERELGAAHAETVHTQDGLGNLLQFAEHQRDEALKALRIIAGERQCIDNLMSNSDIARETLRALSTYP